MKYTRSAATSLISTLLAASITASAAYANLMPVTPSPYSFGPEGRPLESFQQEFSKPVQMVTILPNRPVQATDKYGNKVFYSPNGSLVASIAKDGTVTLSLKGSSIERDSGGNLTRESHAQQGTNRVDITNESGDLVGYQILGLGNKVLREYDLQDNLTKTHTYDEFGKNKQFIMDELIQTKTVFDNTGKAIYDVNEEGAQIAWYNYNDRGVIDLKTDIRGNKTYFENNGEMQYTEDWAKNVMVRYTYKNNDEGRRVLDTSVDFDGNVTQYENGRAIREVSKTGELGKEYHYNKQTLVYTFDNTNKETTWHDIDGKTLATTTDNLLKDEYVYSKGKLVGIWHDTDASMTVYIHGVSLGTCRFENGSKPTADQIQTLIDKGLIKKQYTN
jgi:hypothetical protein